ncbi:hypothetical protein QQ045_029309 [Rhodiola kirilowii]
MGPEFLASVARAYTPEGRDNQEFLQGSTTISAADYTKLIYYANNLFVVCFNTKDQACEIYKKVEDQKPLRGRNQDAICAACLYLACRIENKARTIAEIYSVANGATKKEIGRASDFIKKQLDGEGQTMELGTVQAGDLLRRFCSKLGMSNQEIKAAHEAVQKAEELDIRRIPKTVAAAVIYIISQLSSNQMSLKDISVTTDVAEGTIKNSYKDLQPYLLRIIPSWYANEHEIKRLARP